MDADKTTARARQLYDLALEADAFEESGANECDDPVDGADKVMDHIEIMKLRWRWSAVVVKLLVAVLRTEADLGSAYIRALVEECDDVVRRCEELAQ